VPDRTATTLLRLARDPRTGRLRHPSALDVGLRASLFADLVLSGRVISEERAPLPTPADPTGDAFLDALRDAVAARPRVAWLRWFRHVHSDRGAIVSELVAQGRWTPTGGRLRPTYRDDAHAEIVELSRHVAAVAEQRRTPDDGYQVILAIIATLCGAVGGRPRPRALRRELRPLLDYFGVPEDPIRRALQANLTATSIAIRRVRRGRAMA
jgi:Golgi phosphoprotein 3 (GPP34)